MTTQIKSADPRRNGDLAMIHLAAKALFGDVSRQGDGRDDYEAWLHKLTGKSSAAKLDRDERISLIRQLRRDNLLPERRTGAGTGGDSSRPTSSQWAKLAALAKARGWDGLDDSRLLSFIRRTAKVDAVRFLSRQQISAVIMGLERWT